MGMLEKSAAEDDEDDEDDEWVIKGGRIIIDWSQFKKGRTVCGIVLEKESTEVIIKSS